jgi:uncharacterized membrane protein YhfC
MKKFLVLILLSGCSALQLQQAQSAIQSCGTAAALTEAQSFLPVISLLVEQQPVNWQAQLAALEQVSEVGALCALEQLATAAPESPSPALKIAKAGVATVSVTDKGQKAALQELLKR